MVFENLGKRKNYFIYIWIGELSVGSD